MLFLHVKISCLRTKDHLVFHWYLYNKNYYYYVITYWSRWWHTISMSKCSSIVLTVNGRVGFVDDGITFSSEHTLMISGACPSPAPSEWYVWIVQPCEEQRNDLCENENKGQARKYDTKFTVMQFDLFWCWDILLCKSTIIIIIIHHHCALCQRAHAHKAIHLQ